MASNRKLGIEEVLVDKDLYIFRGNFKFLQSLKECSYDDPMKVYESFSAGSCELDVVVDILQCSIMTINDNQVSDKKAAIEDLISRFGLQECWYLAYQMLTNAMIGDSKKSKLQMNEKIQQIVESKNFLLTSLRKQPLSWAYQVWIFGTCLWVSFRFINPLFT